MRKLILLGLATFIAVMPLQAAPYDDASTVYNSYYPVCGTSNAAEVTQLYAQPRARLKRLEQRARGTKLGRVLKKAKDDYDTRLAATSCAMMVSEPDAEMINGIKASLLKANPAMVRLERQLPARKNKRKKKR
jgi:hypothetical protein